VIKKMKSDRRVQLFNQPAIFSRIPAVTPRPAFSRSCTTNPFHLDPLVQTEINPLQPQI
jgi:hypothetical protein